MANNRVASFVVSSKLFFFLIHYLRFTLRANCYFFECLSEIFIRNHLGVTTSRNNSCFVSNVGKVSTTTTGSFSGKLVKIHGWIGRLILEVHLQNLLTISALRQHNISTTIETTRAK